MRTITPTLIILLILVSLTTAYSQANSRNSINAILQDCTVIESSSVLCYDMLAGGS